MANVGHDFIISFCVCGHILCRLPNASLILKKYIMSVPYTHLLTIISRRTTNIANMLNVNVVLVECMSFVSKLLLNYGRSEGPRNRADSSTGGTQPSLTIHYLYCGYFKTFSKKWRRRHAHFASQTKTSQKNYLLSSFSLKILL